MLEMIAFEILALECGILPDKNQAIIAIGANAITLQIGRIHGREYSHRERSGSW